MADKKREKLPMNYMTNEFMDQQLTTLNKLNKKEEKNATNDANGNGSTTRELVGGDSESIEDSDSEFGEERFDAQSSTKGS